ncbi:enoyl-CoA hydratase/isomerase family protein [Cryptosporangium aurantiacum]|uniref:2-(1,2-epoxy-1,2-dihydrophenyl)acetyl-CoA isomerase n=1 Tax=Cryptosporangium aurantiacum TaxID=134849 RepID=A0A1M7RK68_9ACTN|nr:enoyl-CoA hydratase-related protein [Cryptosporangium aurantiacum]SHN46551.1 2-(1,2-epoxy-1,2-dihydrophenyl)acetyl-CoA isomerase [Cryptosporangium aurantiacum]
MGTDRLGVVQDGAVLRLRLDRPDKRNALDDVMVAGLIEAVVAAGSDESVRAVLLTGAGDHFCSGADIVARNAGIDGRPRVGSIQRRLPWQAHRLVPVLLETQVPIVCGVRGWAAGIGLGLALAADVTVVAEDARLWAPYAARGFTPDGGVTWMLPRRIGEVRARRMLLLGERVDGVTAAEWGLVDRAVSSEAVDAEAEKVAIALAAGPTVALGLAKSLLHTGRSASLEAHLRDEAFGMELSSRSEDFREGLAAFREKRSPDFTGR